MDFPTQESNAPRWSYTSPAGRFDMRDGLIPRRLTLAMWDQAFLLRHIPGGSFWDYDRVLDEAIERGYNTLRLDPLPQLLDLARARDAVHALVLEHRSRGAGWPLADRIHGEAASACR